MIPKHVSEVSKAWMSETLGKSVSALDFTQIGQGVGIMGDIFRVDIGYDPKESGGPKSVVVKLPSSFEENRAQGLALGMFEAEVRFYQELAGAVAVGLPKIYAADIDRGTADFVIVMEDLSNLTMVQQSVGMSAEQAMTAVRILANVHATWWDSVQVDDLEWIPSMVGDRIAMVDQMLLQLLPGFLDAFGDALPAGGRAVYEHFAGRYLKVNQDIAKRSPWTLCHQDFRVENLLFGPAGSNHMVVIDWQGIGRGPAAYDLGYLLSGSMRPEVRRKNEQALLAAYHDSLSKCGVQGYSMDQLIDDYAVSQLQGGLATAMVVGAGMDLSNARGRELATTMAARHVLAAMDHGGLERLKSLA